MNRWTTIPPQVQTIGKTLGVLLFAAACLFLAQFHNSAAWIFRTLPGILLLASLIVGGRNRVRAATLLFGAAFMSIIPLFFDPALRPLTQPAFYALFGIWLAVLLITLGIVIRVVSADDRERAANRAPHAE